MEVLGKAIKKLDGKQVEPVKLAILEFVSTAAMLGLQDLADVSKRFEDFLLKTVAPGWDAEAVATLSFTMGALLEKMQLQEYGPKFSSGLGEITLYLEMYNIDESESKPPGQPESFASPEGGGDMEEDAEALVDDELDNLLSEAHLMADLSFPASESESEFETWKQELEASLPLTAGERDKAQLVDIPSIQEAVDFELAEESPVTLKFASVGSVSAADEGARAGVELPREDEREAPPIRPTRDMGFVMDRVEWYRQLLRHDPTSQTFLALAEEFCFRSQWREAVETCRKGLMLHPYLTRGRALMGWALWELGKVGEAEQVLTEAKSELEVNGFLYRILGEIAKSRGDAKSAENYMRIFGSLSPEGSEGLAIRAIPRTFEEQPQVEAPSIVEFLTSLLHRFEGKRSKALSKRSIFSETERQSLKHMLTASMH